MLGSIQMDIKPIIPVLDKKKYRWIGWDAPGHGRSRPPNRPFLPPGYGCGYEYDVKYATELLKILEIDCYTIVSWSGGAITGIRMAHSFPDQVSSLVTWGGWGFVGTAIKNLLKSFQRQGINGIPESRRVELTEMYGEKLLQDMWDGATDEVIAMSETDVYQDGGSFEEVIKNVKCPALVIHGTKDAFFPVSYAHHLNSTFRNSRLHIVKNGTHNLHLRQTDEFVKCIEGFIDSCLHTDQLKLQPNTSFM
ncbi:Valacyclovir hydrolase [Orchesella cincta]|uniref:Valacyclovir hydrolase n=1 Tax=Orchesella cincta TaxID=48709 RepID=A0A1D2MC19_ORCCI|nr:Valacyclovir hydrolase [Orchesella cincta]